MLVAFSGIKTLSDQAGYSEGTNYDWSVSKSITVDQNDMVRAAEQIDHHQQRAIVQAALLGASGRRLVPARASAGSWPSWMRTVHWRPSAAMTSDDEPPSRPRRGLLRTADSVHWRPSAAVTSDDEPPSRPRRGLLRTADSTLPVTADPFYAPAPYAPYAGFSWDWALNLVYTNRATAVRATCSRRSGFRPCARSRRSSSPPHGMAS